MKTGDDRIQCRALQSETRSEQEFLDAHRKVEGSWPGLKNGSISKTGDRTYCIIAAWLDMDALAKVHPEMIATLNSFREHAQGSPRRPDVTDPASGLVVLVLK